MKEIRILQAGRIFGKNYFAGQIVKNPPDELVMRAENKDRAHGNLICEFAGTDINPDALMKLTKADLLEMVKENDIKVDVTATKKDIVNAILASDKNGDEVKEESSD